MFQVKDVARVGDGIRLVYEYNGELYSTLCAAAPTSDPADDEVYAVNALCDHLTKMLAAVGAYSTPGSRPVDGL